ncbi:hypothetical protein SAMN02910368_01971 [Lachnospiraceae bacterium G11]|nr:hypothetical protein SAMN02910368_01971 [Lachnospiraceae bacterium G11]
MGSILANIIIIAIVVLAVGGASYYIHKEKKKGRPCIGCPMAGDCAKAKAGMACKK